MAIKYKPDHVFAYLNRGTARAYSGDLKGAINDFNIVIKNKPDFAEGYINRGMAMIRLKQVSEGCHDLKIAASLGSERANNAIKLNCN